jgi:hypothetical protein
MITDRLGNIWAQMGDAEYAAALDGTSFEAVAGYLAAPEAAHAWSEQDWHGIPGPKLPIWEAGYSGRTEAESCLAQLEALGAKECYVALAMETRKDISYVSAFGAIMQHHDYRVLVTGSASSVFDNPPLNGYWVEDYTYKPFMYKHSSVRATQWTDGELYDQSTVKPWILKRFWV